jgi:2-oxoglutarate/2-oxoacid ferredoxin oxidoreductase subunit alpha
MEMDSFSALVGGIAGDGINEAGVTIGRLLNQLGYRIYMYYDYPSLIRGGHNSSLVRASKRNIAAHGDKVDILLAMNQDTIDIHKPRLKESSFIIYDQDKVNVEGLKQKGCGLPITSILKEEGAPPIMRNSCMIGTFCKVVGISWEILELVLTKHVPKALEMNLKVTRKGYDSAVELFKMAKLDQLPVPIIQGNQAIALGMIKAGLRAYVAYPMTPASSLLDFMARSAETFNLKVIHPENEIAVVMMALGFAYAGTKTAIGTSGGGFCLMTEGVSLAGQAEQPMVVMLGQRTGPSTGLPTYTAQSDLLFALIAGQGEFPRFVTAPGDAEEAYYWSGVAMNMAWKYQVVSIILSDKTLSEGIYSFDRSSAGEVREESLILWSRTGKYNRYRYTESCISPLAFPPVKGQAIKSDSYYHDEYGITTEDGDITKQMSDKRLLKERSMADDLKNYQTVKIYGQGKTALLCWGSNKGVCIEIAEKLGLKVIQVLVMSPFPVDGLKKALEGVERLIAVECNSTGQLASLVRCKGFKVDDLVLKYTGRPFSLEDLDEDIRKVIS